MATEKFTINLVYVGEESDEVESALPPLLSTEGFYVKMVLFEYDLIYGIFSVMHKYSKKFVQELNTVITSIVLPKEYLNVVLDFRTRERQKCFEENERAFDTKCEKYLELKEKSDRVFIETNKELRQMFSNNSTIKDFLGTSSFEGTKKKVFDNGTVLCEYEYVS